MSDDIRASYTFIRTALGHYYRGAIRRRSDEGVIWECDHEHAKASQTRESALWCAQTEYRRTGQPAAVSAEEGE